MAEENEHNVVYFGRVDFRSSERLFGVRREDRRQHMYVIGKTGTGKSAMLHNLIVQDIANGEGLCVVDPHGDLVESILPKIPKERMDDVIYFNPADADFNIGFNVLELPDPKYKHLVASGLMGIFTKIWSNVWSARMEYILSNAILALLDTPGTTLLGVSRILVDKEFRQRILANVKDPVVRSFWLNEYEEWRDQFRNEAIAPIQNKVGQFLSTALVRNIVGQAKSTIDIFNIMNDGKIFLVNVSKGRIGEDNSALLGAMLITKIQLASMERVRVPEEERVDFYLYVDEFQNFATDSFAGILSEARKYRLNLILAHQYVGQLVTMGAAATSTKVRDAVFGNVGTMVVFRVGAADAEYLESEFSPEFTPEDIVNLPNYSVYLKLMVDGVTSRPFSAHTLPPFKVQASGTVSEEIINNSRKRYARPRYAVEEEIAVWSGMAPGASHGEFVPRAGRPAQAGVGGKYPTVCSSCKKETTVPFEPQPGRPVYCQDCLAKIKAGELEPVRAMPTFERRGPVQTADMSALAGLGIEFSGKAPSRSQREEGGPPPRREGREEKFRPRPQGEQQVPPANRQGLRPSFEPRPSILRGARTESAVTSEEKEEHELRLSELTPANGKEARGPQGSREPDIVGLREALRSALGKLKE
ncbi:hypothetical protein COX26_01625 [Candidatus Jorgensenbacteria bacterium CG23_combo_of_CG06-09_8_20_14_all_54_14]|uniref:Uncharacterized protein n=2 Tax=Candidatus Joergenseniibacteriota TaxID=1752739 RepID=A0A2G9Z9U6_9BACT|nr:MAG: hypothetical protein COX26_01625 [Candidatus Jorgensenbacteria bacterium CG23_combo_of_CG06-09_8_20_14_all_54_14]